MLRSRTYVISLTVLLATAGYWMIQSTPSREQRKEFLEKLRPLKEVEGEEEDEEKELKLENSRKRAAWEFKMLRDPRTNQIPEDIRRRELLWVKEELGRQQSVSRRTTQNTYQFVGPSRNGGRVRALAFDRRYNGGSNRVILAGGISGGIFKSIDGGNNWRFVHPEAEIRSVSCFAQDPRPGQENVWYAGTGEAIGSSQSYPASFIPGHGIFKSVDNGETWFKLNSTTDVDPIRFNGGFDIVNRIVINNQGHVFAAVHRQIQRSTDGGNTWAPVLTSATNIAANSFAGVTDLAIKPDGSKVFASFTGRNADRALVGVWESSNGTNWTRIAGGVNGQPDSVAGWAAYNNRVSGGLFTDGYGRIVMTVAPSNPNIMYILYENGGNAADDESEADFFRVDMSTSPYTWSPNRRANLRATRERSSGNETDYFQAQTGYNLIIGVHPTNPDLVLVGGVNLYRSTSAFSGTNNTFVGGESSNSYTEEDNPDIFVSHPDYHELAFDPTNANRLFVATDGGIQVTDDITASGANRVNWRLLNSQLATIQYYHVNLDPTPGSWMFIGGAQDNSTTFRDRNNRFNFNLPDTNDHVLILGGDGGSAAFSKRVNNNQFMYCSAQEGQIYRFPMQGNISPVRIKPNNTGSGEFVTMFHLDPDNTDYLYLALEDSLYRTLSPSTVSASSGWEHVRSVTNGVDGSIFSMATTRGDYTVNSNLFIGTSAGKIYRVKNPAFVAATTTSSTAIDITPPGMVAGSVVSGLAVNPRNDDTLIAVVSNYGDGQLNPIPNIFWTGNARSANPTWQVVEGNLSLPSVRSCAVVAKTTGVEYYVGTSVGLFSTATINGNNTVWTNEGTGALRTALVNSLAYRWQDNLLLVGTHGNGMYAANIGNAVNVVTGTNDPVRNDKNFIRRAYPTIVTDRITFETGNMLNLNAIMVEITNLAGQVVYKSRQAYQNGTIPVNQLPAGAYVLVITSTDRRYQFVQKLVRQ